MQTDYTHLSPAEATQLQAQLREKIQLTPVEYPIKTIAGADISFNKYSEVVYAGIVILAFPSMAILHRESVVTTTKFPYIPGLLAFREIPALAAVWNKLSEKPDVLVLDGHGIAHPRRMGIATHFGILAGIPTIGCGKTRLTGTFQPPADEQFTTSPLLYKGEQIGEVLRTKAHTNPVFVSPGNLTTQEQSTDIVKQCVRKYRIPEPTRQAHLWVNEVRLAAMNK